MKRVLALAAAALSFCMCSSYDLADHVGICTGIDKAGILQQAGASYIEISISGFLMPEAPDSEWEENLALTKASPLPILSGNGFFPGDIRLTGPEAETQRALAYSETAFARGEQIGMKYFVLGSGNARRIPEGFDPVQARAQFVELLKGMAPLAAKHGITVVIEPLRTQETNFINSVHEGYGIVKEVGEPSICVLADLYHMAQVGEGPESIIEAGDALRHCHIAECEERTAPGVKGDDFTPYFKALRKTGYKGSISIECRWDDFEVQAGPAIAEVKRQIETTK